MSMNPDQWADDAHAVLNQADAVAEDPAQASTYGQFAEIITDQANHEHENEQK